MEFDEVDKKMMVAAVTSMAHSLDKIKDSLATISVRQSQQAILQMYSSGVITEEECHKGLNIIAGKE